MSYVHDTIVGLATAPGEGGIAIVRLSGPESIALVDRIFFGKYPISQVESHTLNYGKLVLADLSSDSLEGELMAGKIKISDQVLVGVMKAPKSYTCEDVVEINSHGGTRLAEEIIQTLVAMGARRAERGEFTERAFLNGRVDLTEAEAVLSIVKARTSAGLSAACFQLHGGLSSALFAVSDGIAESLARIEVGLEFVEDQNMSDIGSPKNEGDQLSKIAADVQQLIATYKTGKLATDGATIALIGEPNVGKSSLLNAMLGHERAIVASTPGTTRDVVEGELDLEGVRVRLLDTAGLRETSDTVEEEGAKRARAAAESADLAVLVLDASSDSIPDEKLLKKSRLVVLNKCDLCDTEKSTALGETVARTAQEAKIVLTTATTSQGIDDLTTAIREILLDGTQQSTGAILINQRHHDALILCKEAMDRALGEIKGTAEPVLVAADLRDALDAVGTITGATTPSDVMRMIFDGFCIGK